MKYKFHSTPQVWVATFVAVIFSKVPLFAQTNSETTNATLKLLPPYGELPPTFWEQNAPAISFAGLGAVALVAFVLWLIFRTKPKIIIPPEVQAREALQKLRAQPEDGAVLSRISQVVRIYFSLQRLRGARPDDWDAKMVERVRSQGIDPFKPTEVDFFFALPDMAACDAVRAVLQVEVFQVDIKPVTDSSTHPFSLHASKALRLAVPDMQEKSRRFKELAAAHGGRYDGWAAGATREG